MVPEHTWFPCIPPNMRFSFSTFAHVAILIGTMWNNDGWSFSFKGTLFSEKPVLGVSQNGEDTKIIQNWSRLEGKPTFLGPPTLRAPLMESPNPTVYHVHAPVSIFHISIRSSPISILFKSFVAADLRISEHIWSCFS